MEEEDLMEALLGGRKKQEPASLPLPEAQIETLQEVYNIYIQPCRFKPGDLVTPRPGGMLNGAGIPHIVLEVADPPIRNFPEDSDNQGSSAYGTRLDVRVFGHHPVHGHACAWWQESWQLAPYEG